MTVSLTPEDQRKIRNEILARSTNRKVKKVVKEHTPAEEQEDLIIDFYCECSDETCEARVPLTLEEYEEAHKDTSRFIVLPGHQTPAVESIARVEPDYSVVTKPALK